MPSNPPKLLDRVRLAIRVRHYSRRTEECYVAWVRRYVHFHESNGFWSRSRDGGAR